MAALAEKQQAEAAQAEAHAAREAAAAIQEEKKQLEEEQTQVAIRDRELEAQLDRYVSLLGSLSKLYGSMAHTSDRIHKLLVKLETLGKIEKDDKMSIGTDGKFQLHRPGLFTGMWRSMSHDGRHETLKAIKETTDYSIAELRAASSSKDTITKRILLRQLAAATVGIWELRKTYYHDRQFLAEVTVLGTSIKAELREQGMREKELPKILVDDDELAEAKRALVKETTAASPAMPEQDVEVKEMEAETNVRDRRDAVAAGGTKDSN